MNHVIQLDRGKCGVAESGVDDSIINWGKIELDGKPCNSSFNVWQVDRESSTTIFLW